MRAFMLSFTAFAAVFCAGSSILCFATGSPILGFLNMVCTALDAALCVYWITQPAD